MGGMQFDGQFKIPTPEELRQQELARASVGPRSLVAELIQEVSIATEKVMRAFEKAFADGEIDSAGGMIWVDDLEGQELDLFDPSHCAMLQNAVNSHLQSAGWECEIFEASCGCFAISPALKGP